MRLFFDRRLGYLVTAPGQDSALSDLTGKAGDTTEVQIVFGRSSDPTGSSAIIDSPVWTPENLPGGTAITIGLKEDGDYGDGALLAGTSTFTLNAETYTYTFTLPLNTTAINTALNRLDEDDENETPSLDCQFEVTYQIGGSGGWESSILPVSFLIYNDIIGGDEGTPTNADDPDEYLLKASGYEWLPTVTSKTGGTSIDLDAIPTVDRPVGGVVAFKDEDAALNQVRLYRLETGTDAEDSPDYIRPDDFNASTNAKVWVFLRQVSEATGMSDIVEDGSPQLGGPLDANANQIREAKGADVASATSLAIGNDGNYFVVTGTTTIATIATKGIGTEITLQFSGALILTHSADLVLPTAANITTTAGDVAKFREHASGDWRCVSYLRANGQALATSGGGAISNLVEDITPQLGGPLDANSKQIRESLGVSTSAATPLAIGDDGNYFIITGSGAIETIAPKAVGTEITLQFFGGALLTHGENLVLPTSANIICEVGDVAKFRQDNSTRWRCVSYLRVSGLSLATDIVEDGSPQLGGPLDANANQIREAKGADVASATSLAIGNDGNYFDVTGTTTIATIDAKAVGTTVKLHFDAALTLTHSADLVLPTAANIITAAGDEAEFVEYATGDWRCVSYTRANGKALDPSEPNAIAGVNEITTTRDLALTDIGKLCLVDTTGGAITLTIPLQSSVTWPANTILRIGHTVNEFDLVTINAASGAELKNSINEPNVTLSIGKIVTIYRVAQDTWRVIGSN